MGVSCWCLWALFRSSLQTHVIPDFDMHPLNRECPPHSPAQILLILNPQSLCLSPRNLAVSILAAMQCGRALCCLRPWLRLSVPAFLGVRL